MNHQTYFRVSGIIFLACALFHLWIITQGYQVSYGEVIFPVWGSWAAVIIGGYLAYYALRRK